MNWSSEKPSEPGWYWLRGVDWTSSPHDDPPDGLVRVTQSRDRAYWWANGALTSAALFNNGEWLGPITPDQLLSSEPVPTTAIEALRGLEWASGQPDEDALRVIAETVLRTHHVEVTPLPSEPVPAPWREAEIRAKAFEEAAALIPTSWLDSMMTDVDPKAGCPAFEELLRRIRDRLLAQAKAEREGSSDG